MSGGICSNPGCALPWTHKGGCLPGQMCGTSGCTLPLAHLGMCRVQGAYQPFGATPGPYQPAGHPDPRTVPCRTPGCGRAAHDGVCLTPVPGGTRVSLPYGPGEFTAWPVTVGRPGQLTPWAFFRAVCTSPLGAFFGLALLVLCWLAGCA